MLIFNKTSTLVFLCLVLCSASTFARAQALPGGTRFSVDFTAAYTAIHANEGPGDCGCFYMTGGSGELAVKNSRNTSFLINFGRTAQTNINGYGQNLTFYTVLEGARYNLASHSRFSPFGEGLVGVSHTTSNYEIYKSTNSAALMIGGGVDVRLGSRLSVRPVQADWLFTTHLNSVNNFQNMTRLSAGLVFHLHRANWD